MSIVAEAITYPRDYLVGGIFGEPDYTTQQLYEREELQAPGMATGGTIFRGGGYKYDLPGAELERQRWQEELVAETLFGVEAEKELNLIYDKYLIEIESQVNQAQSQTDLDKIVISIQSKAEKEADEKIKKLEKKYEGEFEAREDKRVKKYEDRIFSEGHIKRVVEGLFIGASYTIPFAGQMMLGADITRTAIESPSIISQFKRDPFRMGVMAGETVLGIGIAGFGIGKLKAISKTAKIQRAIGEAKVNIKSKGFLTEAKIDALKISQEGKLQLKNLIKKGGRVTRYDIDLKANPKFIKNTPKVKGSYLEVLDQTGNLIDRIGVGTLEATLQGKTINQALFNQAILMVDKKAGGVSGYSEVVTGRLRGELLFPSGRVRQRIVKPKMYKFIEESKLIFDRPFQGKRIVMTESTAHLMKVSKYKGQEFLTPYTTKARVKVLPDIKFLKTKAKPYVKAVAIEELTPSSLLLDVRTISDIGIAGMMKRYVTKGRAVAERIKPKVKKAPSRIIRGFDDSPTPSTIFKRPPPPKPKVKVPKVKEVPPSLIESLFYGKQYKVPIGTEEAVFAGIGRLPGELVGGGWGGLIFGVGGLIRDFDITRPKEEIKITEEIAQVSLMDLERVRVKEKEKEEFIRPVISPVITSLELEEQTEILRQQLRQPQLTKLETKQIQKQLFKLQQLPAPSIPSITPTITPPVIPPFFFPGERPVTRKQTDVGYHADVKERGKWKRVTDKPHTRSGAKDAGSRITDHTTSAQFRIEPIKKVRYKKGKKIKTIQKFRPLELQQGDNYFLRTANKFRDYMVSKGQRRPMKNRWIEKKQHRSDTRGESQELTVSQVRARRTKASLGLPTRRTKSKGGRANKYFRL